MKLISLFFLISTSFAQTVWWPKGSRLETFQNGLLFKSGRTVDTTATGFELNGYLRLQSYLDSLQIATPSNPAASANRLYFKTDNLLYGLTSDGVERAIDVRLESDFLLNRSFEESYTGNVVKDWTLVNATPTLATSNNIDGNKHVSLSLSGILSLSQDITAAQFGGSLVGFEVWIKSSIVDVSVCLMAGANESDCTVYDGSDLWRKVQVIGAAPLSGTMGIKIKTDSTTTGTVLVDAASFSTNPIKYKDGYKYQSGVYHTFAGNGSTATKIPYFTTNILNEGSGIVSVVNSSVDGLTITALRDCVIRATWAHSPSGAGYIGWSLNTAAVTTNLDAVTVGERLNNVDVPSGAPKDATVQIRMAQGDVLRPHHNGAAANVNNRVILSYVAEARDESVLTSADLVSSDTIGWSFKATAVTDCGGADAIGRYNTYSKGASNNTFTICGTAPTTLPTGNDGLLMFTAAFNQAGNCTTSITMARICVGKGMKGYHLEGYQSAARGGDKIDLQRVDTDTSVSRGMFHAYNEKTGILELDTGTNFSASNTSHFFLRLSDVRGSLTSGYIHFAIAKTPAILSEIGAQTCYLKDVKASGTAGGTFNAGSWVTRTLNTVTGSCSFLSLSSNQITLSPGVYEFDIAAPTRDVNFNRVGLYSITDSLFTDIMSAMSASSPTGGSFMTAHANGRVQIGSTKIYEIRHRCSATRVTDGLGAAFATFGEPEVFTTVKITKVK